ncbi:MAG: PD40 domain-containing protein [Deltaproteobacteria bacterium]|nr:PD40 domain-containing protein [Deltaproteobacteria bacterium]
MNATFDMIQSDRFDREPRWVPSVFGGKLNARKNRRAWRNRSAWRNLSVGLFAAIIAIAWTTQVAAQKAPERQYTEISGSGQSLYRIAIPPALSLGAMGSKPQTLTSVLANDLKLIGLFKLLDRRGYLANLKAEGVSLVPKDWINVGAQAVVKCRVVRLGRKIQVEWLLYEPGSKGTNAVLHKSYTGRSPRRLAHRFANDIVRYYTKRTGPFLSRIVFASGNPARRRSQVYMMDYDGHSVARISRTGALNVLPALGPSGRVAWTSFLWRNPDLYVGGPGRRARRISRRQGLNTGAAFSPNGKEIALTMSKDGNAEIYVVNLEGTIVRRLTNNPGIDTSPTWSPDGGRIAFVSNRGGAPQIYVMSAAGGGAKRLTFTGSYNQEPSWCPRGATPKIAFTARDDKGAYDVFTINAGGGGLKRLTQGQGNNNSPSWSPDGRLIVFASNRGGLWVMNTDGLNQHRVSKFGQTPSWSR